MKITIEIPDNTAEALTCALREILNQIQPVRLEPIYKEFVSLQVNGTYRTENEKIARCIDIREGKFICEIEGKEYAFWETGSPSITRAVKGFYPHAIIEKIIQ